MVQHEIMRCKKTRGSFLGSFLYMWMWSKEYFVESFGVVVEFVEIDVSDACVCCCFVDGVGEDEVVFRIRVGAFRGCVDEVDVAVFVGGGESFDGLVFYEGAVICIEFVEVFAVEEGSGRRGEVVFVEEVVEVCDVWRGGVGWWVGFPFFRFRLFVDGDAIEGAVAVFEVVLICFVAVVCYAEYGVIGVAVFAEERCEEEVGVLRRLYVDEFFDDGVVVVDGVVVAAAVDDGWDEDAVVEVVSAVIVVVVRRMIVRSVDGWSVMRWADVTTVRRSIVRSHVWSVVWSALVDAVSSRWLIAVWTHIGSVVWSAFVDAASSRRLVAVWAHVWLGLRSLLRFYCGRGSFDGLGLLGHGTSLWALFYLCGFLRLCSLRFRLRCFVRASLRWCLFLDLGGLFWCASSVAAVVRCGVDVACECCCADEHGNECAYTQCFFHMDSPPQGCGRCLCS